MKNILTFLILSLCIIGCEIDTAAPETIYLPNVIKGKAYYIDPLKGSEQVLAMNVNVYLSANPQNDPYLLETKTDSLGNYKFEFIPKVDSFWVFSSSVMDEIIYSDSIKFRNVGKKINKISSKNDSIVYTSSDTLKLQPTYLGATLKLLITQKETILNDAKVFLFVNKDLAKKTNITGIGNIKYETSNKNGIAFFHGLKESQYFVRIVSNENLVDSVYKFTATLDVLNKPLKIEQKGSILINVNRNSQPLNSANVYLFVNKEFSKSLYQDTVQNAIYNKPTNNNGELLIENLNSGTYYLGAKKGNFASDSIITFSIKKEDTLSQELVLIQRGQIKTQVFENGEIVKGADVYLFKDLEASKSIVSATPFDYVKRVSSDTNGRVVFENINKGNYYVGAKKGTSTFLYPEPIVVKNEITENIQLKLIAQLPKRVLKIYVTDSSQNALYGAKAYLFTSRLQAQSMKLENPLGDVFNKLTNSNGYVEFNNIEEGISYFPAASIKVAVPESDSTNKLVTKYVIGSDSLVFGSSDYKTDTLIIK
ncbi:MSCRAMM family protein [Arcticibacterium luteifluviistationis]|uniref:Uncharacterized protein n=1 Tax=Arcticibacterium luteifluviistationis TaxID=1784714 RepID=A0A2Z4G9L1_9BACT|nr:hypothetical protein [Arcticibacterium luteifluviistationis]AWV97901.1 hypothetical protein DJ013_06860 [Arcticibacterium luteifluviistationis]